MPSPIVEESLWHAQGEKKRIAVRDMFADIAPSYDRLNGLMSLSLHHRWRASAVKQLNLREGDQVLDVCCGTGDFLAPLSEAVGASGKVVGIDFCAPMLAKANQKFCSAAGLALGDACCLPVSSERFDAATVGWGIRNVPDIDMAHGEIFRVLRPGGQFVSVDMAVPSNSALRPLSKLAFNRLVPFLGKLFGKTEAYTYLPKSTERFMSRTELKESMEKAGFQGVQYRDLFFGNICMHWGVKP